MITYLIHFYVLLKALTPLGKEPHFHSGSLTDDKIISSRLTYEDLDSEPSWCRNLV